MNAEWLATLWSCESVPECPNIGPCVSRARGRSPVELVLACLSLCTRVEVRELLNTGRQVSYPPGKEIMGGQ